ncbi:PAS domain-containing hybrid sensor histidine kinase/response regulator [Flavobacterium sp.]|uniref:PAS domain-containing hybrid sensor histidine kinase/response regulator n=1 Tax=Flavobacterium sp. TaxID=239 RepID=UPI0026368AD2|nr:PAS domain-containing hybrid sensor histidine kinase/response regulator [Flavobacterium sp.]
MAEFHKLLQKQINKHLPLVYMENPLVMAFLNTINDSYTAFERDRDLMSHSFRESEKEYNEINQNLTKEYELKQQSISNLYDTLEALEDDYKNIKAGDDVDDILFISKYLNQQIENRKNSEKNLSRTVELLKTLLANLRSGILVEDENRIILFTNQLFCEMFSIPVTPDEMVGIDCTNSAEQSKHVFKNPDSFSDGIAKILSQREVVTNELLETAEGRFFERDYIPIYIANEYKGHLWKYTDVTERIENQILLEQSEERSRIVMNSSLNAIVTVDDKGKITFWNDQATSTFGYTYDEVFGKVFTEFMIPERNKALWEQSIYQYLTEGHNEFLNKHVELVGVHRSGNEFLAEVSIIPITQNGETFFCAFLQDISKRKEAEYQLSENLVLLKTLLANLQSGILVEDMNRKIVFTNQLFCDMRNISLSPNEMVGIDCKELIKRSQLLFKNEEQFAARITDIIARKKMVIQELLETKDNLFYERDYIPIVIEEEYKGHLWKYTDVTQRIQDQMLLAQSEERNRNIMNASLNAIININHKGVITFWNNQAEVIFGWKKEEVIGKTLTETIIPKQHHQGHNNGMKHYLETGEGPALNKNIELPAVNRQGEEFPIEIAIIPLKENGELFFCAFIQDISERKKAEKKLKFQEEKYRNIISNMNLGIIEVDNQEIIQFANQSFATMSGFDIEDLMGKNPSEIFVFGENLDRMQHKKELRTQGVSDVYQMPVKDKRGELKWWAISGAPNYDDQGNLVGSVGIHLDITEQKQLEIELNQQKLKAEEASKAKEVFLANMSHEIRTPLNAIIGFLRELGKQELSELQKKYIDNSTIASRHLLAILNNILDISKIEAGEMELEKEDFSFGESIDKVIKVLHPLAKEKDLRLNATIDPKISAVLKADSLRIEQILFNIVGNSIKFTSKGRIDLKCELITDRPSLQKIRIKVTDTGIGMDQNYIETIFKKFSQEDKAVTRKFGGTGLGMAITKELVTLMHGDIKIESEKGKGTTFYISLPLEKGDPNKVKQNNKEVNVNISGLSILLVEDNKMNRMVIQNSMQYFDCSLTEAENGIEALELLKHQTFDIILMDIQMPEMDGIEATKIIRNEFKLNTPIIALTANAFKSEIENCKNAGMDDYVTKPFDEFTLIETIAKLTVNRPKNEARLTVEKSDSNVYNLSILRNLSRGNIDFVQKMLHIFIEQTTQVLLNIEIALQENNFEEISRLIHKIKPSIESLGITKIIPEIVQLEKITKSTKNKEEIAVLLHTITPVLSLAISQLQKNELQE